MNSPSDPLLKLLLRLHEEGVRYILVGGQAVRLNGFVRATEDIDLLLPSSRQNGERLIRALNFLPSASELDPRWFEPPAGETWESLQPFITKIEIEGVPIVTLNIECLLRTKTDYRDKDRIDREALERLLGQLRDKR